mgnify:CR=1 FL=1
MKSKKCLLLCMSAAILMTACQSSPEEDIVVNKNEGVLESAIKDSSSQEVSDAPDTYQDEFTNDAGDVTVQIDAQVFALNNAMPVIRVTPHEITGEEVKTWAEVLFDGQEAYEPNHTLTKNEIEAEILRYKQMASNKDRLIEEYGSESQAQSMIDDYNRKIADYESMYDTAPEAVERKTSDWNFHPYDYYDAEASIRGGQADYESLKETSLLEAVSEDRMLMLTAANRSASDYVMHHIMFYRLEEGKTDIPYADTSMEDAEKIADELIDTLGLGRDNWDLALSADISISDDAVQQRLIYTPVYEEIPVIYGPTINTKSEDLYAANYEYTNLEINLYNGEIDSVWLFSPVDIVNIENEDVATISFKEASNRFKTQAQTAYTRGQWVDPEDPMHTDSQVSVKTERIRQGLFRIKEKNNNDEFLIVPVWAFESTVYLDDEAWTGDICLINAVDGSVIDASLGY